MTRDFSREPLEGDDAAKIRKMHHEWEQFRNSDMEALKKVSWAIKNWKFLGLIAIIGAAGQFTKILEAMKAWMS